MDSTNHGQDTTANRLNVSWFVTLSENYLSQPKAVGFILRDQSSHSQASDDTSDSLAHTVMLVDSSQK